MGRFEKWLVRRVMRWMCTRGPERYSKIYYLHAVMALHKEWGELDIPALETFDVVRSKPGVTMMFLFSDGSTCTSQIVPPDFGALSKPENIAHTMHEVVNILRAPR